jgi:hypothetical protein
MQEGPLVTLRTTVPVGQWQGLAALLGKGFWMQVKLGESVEAVLCDQIGLDRDYFDQRVQTLFLNGSPVDQPASARVADGDLIALSAAMPGLAGATLRKGGHYAALRDRISHLPRESALQQGRGWITIRLFNMVAGELAGFFLTRGIWLAPEQLSELLSRQPDGFRRQCREMTVDGHPVDPFAPGPIAAPAGKLLLSIEQL